MIAELNELQIKDIVGCNTLQTNTIKQINENYALNIFKNGLKGELRPTVFASRPKELNEAVQLALELEKPISNNSYHNIFHITIVGIIIIGITLILILEEMQIEITIRVTTTAMEGIMLTLNRNYGYSPRNGQINNNNRINDNNDIGNNRPLNQRSNYGTNAGMLFVMSIM